MRQEVVSVNWAYGNNLLPYAQYTLIIYSWVWKKPLHCGSRWHWCILYFDTSPAPPPPTPALVNPPPTLTLPHHSVSVNPSVLGMGGVSPLPLSRNLPPKHCRSPYQPVMWGACSPLPLSPNLPPPKHSRSAYQSVNRSWELWGGGMVKRSSPALGNHKRTR